MTKISPSVLASDFSKLGEESIRMEKAGAHYLHLDVMDGHFVPNISFGAPVIASIRKYTGLVFDVHLMISNPLKYAEDFAKAGADIITFHIESDSDISQTIDKIRSLGCKVGISLKPKTPANEVFDYLDKLDMVLVMTVEPGFGGQSFMVDMLPKIEEIKGEIDKRNLKVDIQVDGGVDENTITLCSKAGANVFVAGSAIFKAPDAKEKISQLIENAKI